MAVAEPYVTRRTLRGRDARPAGRRCSRACRGATGSRSALLVLVTAARDRRARGSPRTSRTRLASTSALPIPPFHHGFLLGTDDVGHDIFSRVLYGIRIDVVRVARRDRVGRA